MRAIWAKHFTPGVNRVVDLVVIHSMESSEGATTAENVANWFGGPTAPQASAHFCLDAYSVIQCVRLADVAWAAPGANHNGVHIEIAGRAGQTPGEWADPYSSFAVDIAARLTAELCIRYELPVRFVTAEGLLSGQQGITTHAEVTKAFKKSTHTDPGPHFPMEKFIRTTGLYVGQSVGQLL